MNLEKLNEILNYNFENKELLIEALTHSSYSYENKLCRNYERLEFLGDAVLQLIVSEYLIFKYKDFDEGMLSRYRAYFVSEEFISELAKQIDLGNFIRLGKGELNSGVKIGLPFCVIYLNLSLRRCISMADTMKPEDL